MLRHVGALQQFRMSERVLLVVSLLVERLLPIGANYREAKRLMDEVGALGWSATRVGAVTHIEMDHGKWGRLKVALRRSTSDSAVFRQVLLRESYSGLIRLVRRVLGPRNVRFVIDGGANIGLASLVFARAFPNADVWAFEPDLENYRLCLENLRLNGARSVALHRRALWGSSTELSVEHGAFRDGRAWSARVIPTDVDAAGNGVQGVDLAAVLREAQRPEIDVLKLDIEGAEEDVFAQAAAPRTWLDRTRVLAVEVHRGAFYDRIVPVLSEAGFFTFRDEEITIAVKRDAVSDASLLDHFRLRGEME